MRAAIFAALVRGTSAARIAAKHEVIIACIQRLTDDLLGGLN